MREENNYRCLIDYMRNSSYEVHQRWENTSAYREHIEKTKNYTKEKWAEANNVLMAIFAEFAALKNCGAAADSAEAQALVAKLQAHITANYYTCTDEILAGLGKMYVADERFKKNIDKCGDGTAEYASEAIEKALAKADSENMLSCSYLGRTIDEGLCCDIQMIANGYILPSALPNIEIDKSMALKACETCKHKLREVEK